MSQGILYISYEGMLEPLGQSQVLAYLEKLAPTRRIHLISFEKARDWRDRERREAMKRRMALAGIGWHPLRYHKRPTAPATAYDMTRGAALAVALAKRHRLGIVHARSYVGAMMALPVKRMTGARFLFDMRGLWADERVDGGLWSDDGSLYRTAKRLEKHFLLAADHVVTLTHRSEEEIRSFPYLAARMPPISVIPTCADLDRFNVQGAPPSGPFTLGYLGSVGTWYLLDEMLRFFLLLRRELADARLLVVNRNEQQLIGERAAQLGIEPGSLEIVAAEHRDVPALIGRMTAGMALIKPSYSKIASAPTKLAEYLGCGVPCLGNTGVGDVAEILDKHRTGIALDGFSEAELREGVRALIELTRDPGLQQRCRATAVELFSLDHGVAAYEQIYEALEPASPAVG
jgi:glycosyltransferase involved in cell wall biosynthesis